LIAGDRFSAPGTEDKATATWAEDGPEDIDWDYLYHEHREGLRRLIARRVPRNGPVDDIVHETFARAIRSTHLIDTQRPPWPFLATVASRAVADWWQREGARPYGEPSTTAVTEDFPGSDEHASALDRAVAARQALLAMKPRQRRVLYLYEAGDCSYETLTDAEQVSVKAMKSLLARARGCFQDRYRELLAGDAFGLVAWYRTTSRRLRLRLNPTSVSLSLDGLLALGGVVAAGVIVGAAASPVERHSAATASNAFASAVVVVPGLPAPALLASPSELAGRTAEAVKRETPKLTEPSGTPSSPTFVDMRGGVVNHPHSSSVFLWITINDPVLGNGPRAGTETRCDQGEVAARKCHILRSLPPVGDIPHGEVYRTST
jgi:RNA polymerase sigma factor (sigma-70 family)